jgi:hypothetical protein
MVSMEVHGSANFLAEEPIMKLRRMWYVNRRVVFNIGSIIGYVSWVLSCRYAMCVLASP